MTQAQLADVVGVSRGFLSEIVSGKKQPSMDTLSRIVDALGVAPGAIYATETRGDLPAPATGFAESAAVPLTPPADRSARIAALFPQVRHLSLVRGISVGRGLGDRARRHPCA